MFRMLCIGLAVVALAAVPGGDAFAAKKKKSSSSLGSRGNYTSEQREQIYQIAREICRKKFGGTIVQVRVNYQTGSILCWQQ